MRRNATFAAAILACAPAIGSAQDLTAGLDSLVTRQAAADQFSGVVALARNGVIVYQRAEGLANRETNLPMRVDTKLQIASATKLFTNLAIRQLEQAGKLELGDTVGKFLPEYPNPVVRSKVTIEQLLRHRSGIGSFWNDQWMARRAEVRTVGDYLALFQDDSLLFAPGTSETYSNGGYVVLGAIIEQVSGKPYHQYLEDLIFRPAGMSNTRPYDRRARIENTAVGYTRQGGATPLTDSRLAGSGQRPGDEPQSPPRAPAAASGRRLRIVGPDGRELSQEEARTAMAQRAAVGGPRSANSAFQPGKSGPAGDHYSTVGDFVKLATALRSYKLLDTARTRALLGERYAAGSDFRANGGGPGVNAEFSMYPTGEVMVVLSNYDPPAATTIAQFVRARRDPPAVPSGHDRLREEIDSLHAQMVAAFKRNPASVAEFYTDDARIIGMGMRATGRTEVGRYWSQGMGATEWTLETLDVGGTRDEPWVLGRSTLTGAGGRRVATEYIAVLRRSADGRLRYRIDLYTPTERPARAAPPG